VITTSGTLVTLTLGVTALSTRVPSSQVSEPALGLIATAVVFPLGAAVLALAINVPWRQEVLDVGTLGGRPVQPADWPQVDPDLAVQAYQLRVQLNANLRASNQRRSRYLTAALALECAALAALSVGAGWTVLTAH
jgi:hypothetical protein